MGDVKKQTAKELLIHMQQRLPEAKEEYQETKDEAVSLVIEEGSVPVEKRAELMGGHVAIELMETLLENWNGE